MNGGNVPIGVDDIQTIEFWVFVLNAILLESFLHVEGSAKSLPDIASPVFIILQVPVQNLSDCLLRRHLQNSAVVIDHIDYSDPPWLFGELANDVFGVLPPLHLALRVYMQILATRTVKLALASGVVDLDPWFSAGGVEPEGDVSACSLDERSGERVGDVLLNDFGEVVHFSEQNDPTVVCSVVVADLFGRIEPLFGQLNRQILV